MSIIDQGGLFDLQGRIALVTGAGGWLGVPMATALAEAGAHVLLIGRREPPLRELADHLAERELYAEPIICDITDPNEVRQLAKKLEKMYGCLDILVNNASKASVGPCGLDATIEAFSAASEIHVSAAWNLVTTTLPLLRAAVKLRGDASVINITSMYAKVSPVPQVYAMTGQPPNPAYYGAAKAGLLQLTKWLACNLGHESIRVNSISPGPFPQWNAREKMPDFVAQLDVRTALGRIGRRDEVKGVVVFLASKASSYVTGADIAVDGGWTAW